MMELAATVNIEGQEFLALTGEELLRLKGKDIICNKTNFTKLFEPLIKNKFNKRELKQLTEKITLKGTELLRQKNPVCMCLLDVNEKKRYKVHLQKMKSSLFSFLLLRLTDEETDMISKATRSEISLKEFFVSGILSAFKKKSKKDYH